jgi:hypothetical protein
LLAGGLPENRGVLSVEVVVVDIPHVAILVEVGVAASIRELIPQGRVRRQPIEQALPIPVGDRLCGVLVRALWPPAHIDNSGERIV